MVKLFTVHPQPCALLHVKASLSLYDRYYDVFGKKVLKKKTAADYLWYGLRAYIKICDCDIYVHHLMLENVGITNR